MSLNIGEALSTGAEKLTTTAGIQLGVAYVVLQLITALGTNSAISTIDTGTGAGGMGTPALSLPIGIAGGAALVALGIILNIALTIVAFRTLAHSSSELGSIPSGVADGLLKPGVFLVIASIVQGIAIFLGFIALIIPGFFIMISLIFTQVYIAVEDEGPFEALSSSWSLAKGDRFPLFGLGVILFVVSLLASIPAAIVSILSPLAGSVLNYVVTGFISIFSWGVLVAAYQQLKGEAATTTTTTEEEDGVEHLDDDSGFDYA
ncbi:hypothetical protein [Halolamina salifodinae]|uniref:Phosphoglycerol transferase MdoB-like AlkP superfamily enzyme n=1 Tax=Halolamina salifodinae TaxID=1202767 RepID=A0A8T4H2M2_9EURY|nr:hypothetical protein [Halolamina salifodinae]MBP1987875.1 phosphoglycerol transferase MdoB-like AlkP superfamily enzyme [Halolamina salifodinae]